jgi:hypothetical protein
MTLLADTDDVSVDDETRPRAAWVALLLGAGGALASVALVSLAVMAVWLADPQSPGTWSDALGTSGAVWLGLGGATLALDGADLSVRPLVFVLVPLGTALVSAHVLVRRREDTDGWVAGLLPAPLLRSLALWCAGHVTVAVAAVGLTFLGPMQVSGWTLPLPVLGIPLAGALLAIAAAARDDARLLGPRGDGFALPTWTRRAVWPALKGAALLLAVGGGVALTAVALAWQEVAAVSAAVGGGAATSATMWIVQASALPNFALWVVSFCAGPGFSVVEGASTTWSGSHASLMPLVPVLAALPQTQSFPWWVMMSVLVPITAGALIGRWAIAGIARLSSFTAKARVACTAAVGTAVLLGLLDVVSGSSLGAYRLSAIGAPAGWLTAALVVQLTLGTLIAVAWDAWRLRR